MAKAKPVETSPAVAVEESAATGASGQAGPRMETFKATRPDGSVVVVTRNIDTGEQTVTGK